MRISSCWRGLMILGCALLLAPAAWAEVSVELDPKGEYGGFIILGRGGGDGGSPWPWSAERITDPSLQLNSAGDLNGDGPPQFAIDPETGLPTVVWAWFDGQDYEIALSRWTGEEWSTWQILTDSPYDDLDPTVTIGKAGHTTVSWWRSNNPDEVLYRDGDPEQKNWSVEIPLSSEIEQGRYPSATSYEGELVVAYQADPTDSGLQVILVVREGDPWTWDLVASTFADGPAGDGDIGLKVHSRGHLLWIDWVDDQGVLGWSLFDPATGMWSYPDYEPYSWTEADGEPIAREMARVRIRLGLLR